MDKEWAFLLIGLVLGIPFSIFANFATPWLKSYFDKTFFSSRQKRIKALIKDYRLIKSLRMRYGIAAFELIRLLISGLNGIIFMIIFLGINLTFFAYFSNVLYVLGLIWLNLIFALFYMIAKTPLTNAMNYIEHVKQFEKYRKGSIEKLKKLGGNPEELDKEETEGE